MNEPKLIFAGSMGAGKTTAIATISEIAPISTDVTNTDLADCDKLETTVALDYGEVRLNADTRLRLYGTPGQSRFGFIWSLLARDALGVVLLIDNSRPAPLQDLDDYLQAFAEPIASGRVVIGIGRLEDHPRPSLAAYQTHLEQHELLVPVLPADVRRRDDVLLLLEALFQQIECLHSDAHEMEPEDDWLSLVRSARESSP